MLGEQIAEYRGKIICQRVLDTNEAKIETSVTANGTFRNTAVTLTITYWNIIRSGGILYGEGKSIMTTKDNSETVTATARGIGSFTHTGNIRYHGSLFFQTDSTGRLAFVNKVVGLFEVEVDADGNTIEKVWEWK